MNVSEIESTLSMLERRVGALGQHEEPPKTLLRVIEESRTEKAWHLLLAYFIDPSEPHGFGTDALEEFLRSIRDHPETTFEYQAHELESVNVDVEVAADDGRPDMVLWVDDSWFICVEVKVSSGESDNQTERYAKSEKFGTLDVTTIPEERRHYVYIADRRASGANAREFVDVSWKRVVDALDRFRSNQLARFPARSGAQLSELTDHVKHELRMTDETAEYTEKAALALEHRDLREELDDAVERVVEDMQASWDSEFRKDPPEGWTDEWRTIRHGSNYGRILKEDWLLSSNPYGKPKKGKGFGIAFPTELLQENIENGRTHFKLRVYGSNQYSNRYHERFYSDKFQRRIAPVVEKYGLVIEDKAETERLMKTPYSFEFEAGDGYFGVLKQAFQEHLELVPHLEDLYYEIRAEIENEEELFN